MNTDDFYVKITNDSITETLFIAYRPGINFAMHPPVPDDTVAIYAGDDVHTGEIYRIFDYVHVKCKDGCFDTWLQKVE